MPLFKVVQKDLLKRLYHDLCLVYLHSMVKIIQTFSPIFPLMGSIIEHFIGYSYLKKESINRFP